MARLTPHVLEAVRRAHGFAVREADEAARDLEAARQRLAGAESAALEASARRDGLHAAIRAHQDAITAAEAALPTCPACGVHGGHTGGCSARKA